VAVHGDGRLISRICFWSTELRSQLRFTSFQLLLHSTVAWFIRILSFGLGLVAQGIIRLELRKSRIASAPSEWLRRREPFGAKRSASLLLLHFVCCIVMGFRRVFITRGRECAASPGNNLLCYIAQYRNTECNAVLQFLIQYTLFLKEVSPLLGKWVNIMSSKVIFNSYHFLN
jgi:hypothetical protein